jgi:predicted P-loop ATPase
MTLEARPELATFDAACLCAERGLHVIPVWRPREGVCSCPKGKDCISPGKHPAIDGWQVSGSIDMMVLRDWFAADRHNIGVVCGASGIVVVDVDPRNGGNETFHMLTDDLGPLPETVTADSGGGGTHYLFRRPQGDLESKLGNGIDLLRDGRQFLVEPSIHPSGGMYRWRDGHGPDQIAIASLPEAWLKRVRQKQRARPATIPSIIATDAKVERARKYLAKMPGAVSGDGGHTQTFNAVAAAMYGFDLDQDTTYSVIASDYNPRCDPPWSERELRHKIKSVAEKCNRERGYLLQPNRVPVTTTAQAAAVHDITPIVDDGDWQEHLITNTKGTPKRGYANTEVFVRLFPDYRNRWSLNTMSGEAYFDGAPVKETFIHEIRSHIDRRLGFTPPVSDIAAAIKSAADLRSFHPVRQYLDSVDWDGRPRLALIASEYLGADTDLHAQMVRRWMIGAVARAMSPGCQLDTALMLFGKQGFFKSTFFRILGGQWHSDSAIDINNKDAYQQIHHAWIYEFSELENVVTGRAESRLKAFMTSTWDLFRAPYAATPTNKPRSVAFAGTTNRQEILTDDTGSRRFWIVPVAHPIDREALVHARDQLWAEARAAYDAGEPWWFDSKLEDEREKANSEFDQDDPWTQAVAAFVESPLITDITIADALTHALDMEPARQDRSAQVRVARVLKTMGWQRRQRRTKVGREWRYVRPVTESPSNTEHGDDIGDAPNRD